LHALSMRFPWRYNATFNTKIFIIKTRRGSGGTSDGHQVAAGKYFQVAENKMKVAR
jgi:hypothetical protein